MAVMHYPVKFDAYIFIQTWAIDIFFRNSRLQPRQFWIFRLCDHSDVLIVWYLSSVPNLVQKFVIVIGINIGLRFRRSFDNVTQINVQFRLWLSPHGRDASSHKIWCRYLYPARSYWHFSKIQDGGRRHLGFSDYVNMAIPACWQCGVYALCQILLKYLQ